MSPLSWRTVPGGVVYPTMRDDDAPQTLLMGVYDAAGTYVEGTVLDRRGGTAGAPVPPERFPEIEDATTPEAIFAGPLYYHFGHFLLESLARAWYAQRHPDLPLVWAGAHTWASDRGLKPWQTQILEVLGLRNPVRLATGPLRVEVLHVPDIGYRYDDRFHPEHAAFLGRYTGPPQEPGARLWLSRSRLGGDSRDLNAPRTERRLAEAGWTIIHPEQLDVLSQLAHLARAETVAGEEGSAFHLIVLLQDLAGKRFHVFRRRGEEHPNMITIGDAREVHQTFHTLTTERVLRAKGRVVTKISATASEVLDVLEVPVPAPAPPADTPPVTAALQRAMSEVRHERLLVVGDPAAELVLGSAALLRVAVDPHFTFDPRSHTDAGVHFYEMELEESFVEHLLRRHGRFGLVRLAGPTPDAISARFRSSLPLARPHTTWLLGPGEAAAQAARQISQAEPGFEVRPVQVDGVDLHLLSRIGARPPRAATSPTASPPERPNPWGVRRAARRLRGLARSGVRAVRPGSTSDGPR